MRDDERILLAQKQGCLHPPSLAWELHVKSHDLVSRRHPCHLQRRPMMADWQGGVHPTRSGRILGVGAGRARHSCPRDADEHTGLGGPRPAVGPHQAGKRPCLELQKAGQRSRG
uniref:Uncharacterized protein n=1 Tax=Alexandrium monilatum TaxID=311494 RepID=A0A7S4QI97_9DINO